MTESNTNPTPNRRNRRFKRIAIATLLFTSGAVAGGTALVGAGAYALGGHGWHHGDKWTLDVAKSRARERAAWVLGRVDATDEQEHQIGSLLDSALDELVPLVAKHRESRASLVAALEADSVDGQALEKLRTDLVSSFEAGSKVLTRTVSQSAEVLTPEQRRTLIEAMKRHRHRH